MAADVATGNIIKRFRFSAVLVLVLVNMSGIGRTVCGTGRFKRVFSEKCFAGKGFLALACRLSYPVCKFRTITYGQKNRKEILV